MQRASRGGWTPELGGRALAAARIAGAYASGRAIGQVTAGDSAPADGVLVVKSMGRSDMWVSGASTAESANAASGMPDALRALTVARFGRVEKFDSTVDEAIETARRVTKQQRSAHSLMKEWTAAFVANVVDLRKKIWA